LGRRGRACGTRAAHMANQGYRRLDENFPRRLEAGFDFSFTLAYKADDVFKEVTNLTRPLGADGPSLQYTVSEPGVKVGIIRKVSFNGDPSSYTQSKLVNLDLDPNASMIQWEQLESTVELGLAGDGNRNPTFTIIVKAQSLGGCEVTLIYDFAKIYERRSCLESCMPPKTTPQSLKEHLNKTAPQAWQLGMKSRGYAEPSPPDFAAGGVKKLHSATMDAAEEAAIKNLSTPRQVFRAA